MPLIDHPTLRDVKIPDEKGGWYWLKKPGEDWAPIKVEPANENGWPQTITLGTHSVYVADVSGTWGPQLFPPDQALHAPTGTWYLEWSISTPDRIGSYDETLQKELTASNEVDAKMEAAKKWEEVMAEEEALRRGNGLWYLLFGGKNPNPRILYVVEFSPTRL